MNREEAIVNSICGRFPFLADRIYIQKDKRIFTKSLLREEFEQVIAYVHDELNFTRVSHVVGTDDGENLGLLYIFSGSEDILLILRESVPKSNPVIKSISDMYPSIVLHERELVDLFGVVVEGLPEGPHYPLPDGWPEGNYPMRKEWNPKHFNKDTMTYEEPQEKEVQKNE
ncbi:MAG: NADH-quinone oxidoreductase subunit C [Bacillota bacterium]|nr:NADH-quinone oxidoreductase subunit C [Bacillota bacterium]